MQLENNSNAPTLKIPLLPLPSFSATLTEQLLRAMPASISQPYLGQNANANNYNFVAWKPYIIISTVYDTMMMSHEIRSAEQTALSKRRPHHFKHGAIPEGAARRRPASTAEWAERLNLPPPNRSAGRARSEV